LPLRHRLDSRTTFTTGCRYHRFLRLDTHAPRSLRRTRDPFRSGWVTPEPMIVRYHRARSAVTVCPFRHVCVHTGYWLGGLFTPHSFPPPALPSTDITCGPPLRLPEHFLVLPRLRFLPFAPCRSIWFWTFTLTVGLFPVLLYTKTFCRTVGTTTAFT